MRYFELRNCEIMVKGQYAKHFKTLCSQRGYAVIVGGGAVVIYDETRSPLLAYIKARTKTATHICGKFVMLENSLWWSHDKLASIRALEITEQDDHYICTADAVFAHHGKIEQADSAHFRILGQGWGTDDKCIFHMGKHVSSISDPARPIVINQWIIQCSSGIYTMDGVLIGRPDDVIACLSKWHTRVGPVVIFENTVIVDADAETFRVIQEEDLVLKQKWWTCWQWMGFDMKSAYRRERKWPMRTA